VVNSRYIVKCIEHMSCDDYLTNYDPILASGFIAFWGTKLMHVTCFLLFSPKHTHDAVDIVGNVPKTVFFFTFTILRMCHVTSSRGLMTYPASGEGT
jgi:hypothetical protein